MTIGPDLAARIRRLYEVEHWRVGTIATQLHVHRDTVRRVLREQGTAPAGVALRRSLLEPYRDFIAQTLEKYPTLTASRLFDMVCERGYAGQRSRFCRNKKIEDGPYATCSVLTLIKRYG